MFGYQDMVVDFRGIPIMLGFPLILFSLYECGSKASKYLRGQTTHTSPQQLNSVDYHRFVFDPKDIFPLLFWCRVFTYEDILARAGIIVNSSREEDDLFSLDEEDDKSDESQGIHTFSLAKLKKMLVVAIEEEDYEKASELRDEIKKRTES